MGCMIETLHVYHVGLTFVIFSNKIKFSQHFNNVQTGNNKVKFQVVTCFVQVMVGGRMRYRASPPPSTYKPGYFVPTSLQGLFSWIKTT